MLWTPGHRRDELRAPFGTVPEDVHGACSQHLPAIYNALQIDVERGDRLTISRSRLCAGSFLERRASLDRPD